MGEPVNSLVFLARAPNKLEQIGIFLRKSPPSVGDEAQKNKRNVTRFVNSLQKQSSATNCPYKSTMTPSLLSSTSRNPPINMTARSRRMIWTNSLEIARVKALQTRYLYSTNVQNMEYQGFIT